MSSPADTLTVALVRETFTQGQPASRLRARLIEARDRGATLAVLPELPLDHWCPASDVARAEDAEPPEGRRHRVLAAAAADASIGVVGGAIVADPASGRRHNTALVFDAAGALVARYRKVHVPWEAGFWERAHYDAGDEQPEVFCHFGLPLGLQLCSDLLRPQGCQILGAAGAEAILAPRATLDWTWERWRTVIRANAITSAVYVLSASRPGPEHTVSIGGPSVAVDPHGEVLLETQEPLAVVTLNREVVSEARAGYPGYLDVRAALYSKGWGAVAAKEPTR